MEQRQAGDDYVLERVPESARYSWWTVAVQRFGQISALSQFLLGAALGFGMTFWHALLAITLGSVILEVVAICTGLIGQKEGLSTSVLARWTGFGRYGSSLIGLVIALSLIGWFGVQSAVSAQGLHQFIPGLPVWALSLLFGLVVTAVVIFGFHSMAWTAYLTVPAFLALAGWSIVSELSRHDIGALVTEGPPGEVLSLAAGTTLVAGGFMVGMVITPDMTRFNRKPSDVVKQTLVGVTLGEYMVALAGVLLAHALKTSDIVNIITSTTGWVGTLILIAGTLKINDWNLYSGSLGVVNFVSTMTGRALNRRVVTACVGLVGSALAAAGILGHFIEFLILLGVAFPPIAGIMVAEYFIVKRFRGELEAAGTSLPATEPTWVPATLAVWLASALIGWYAPIGIGALNSLVVSIVLYTLAGKAGLVRPISTQPTAIEAPKALATT
ncbi:purine-cytosine permease family protein [Streptomyces sp. WMMC940]|uniref:purine-cytosine permease family protein n=2 Tax=Streptomyces sp. WMMC940 TaxID=3015153 RepID=UPI0022B6E100|nr:cytosine permease [Streptomyces sp. WMMC940]MCZ7456120.1 cytosine permease [Streptomyces sp. WMMC940]